jgi:hypothetical protein
VDEGTWRAVGVPLQVEAPATGVRLVVPRKATISGRLVGEGVAGFTVFARPAGADDPEAYTVTVEVGADGRFRLEVWEGSDYTVGATRRDDDRFARLSPVRVGADVTLALEPGLSIEGTLLGEDGKPPTGAWVLGRSATWQTMAAVGADGTWRLRGLPGGTYRVRSFQDVAAAGQEVEAGSVGVRLVAGPR